MKKLLTTLTALSILLIATVLYADESIVKIDGKWYVTVGKYGANLYKDARSTVPFRKIKKGKKLEVLDSQEVPSGIVKNTFFKVKYKKKIGWVSQHSLEGIPGKWYTREMKYGGQFGEWVETKVP